MPWRETCLKWDRFLERESGEIMVVRFRQVLEPTPCLAKEQKIWKLGINK